jgi:septal ring factor EnvC (AmiA/AmiB activator)
VISTLQAENPFDTVLSEIEKMLEVIVEEGKADKEKLEWCKKERKENRNSLRKKRRELTDLKGQIDNLDADINAPEKGLKAQIAQTEESLQDNLEMQKTETKDRQEQNVLYQTDVKNLVAAQALLENAMKVLKGYYDRFSLLQQKVHSREDPDAPETWDEYEGQSKKGGSAIDMLQFILSETKKEQDEAHADENASQHSYEDSMQGLKDELAKQEKSLSDLQENLAKAEEDLLSTQEDHKATTEDKDEIKAYLEKIKPGCDFITTNFDLREKNRGTETSALKTAMDALKGSPAYKNAEADATVESYGECKKPCVKDVAHVKCKACQAKVTIPAYCAGHKGTAGC